VLTDVMYLHCDSEKKRLNANIDGSTIDHNNKNLTVIDQQ